MRLGVYSDLVYRFDGETLSTDKSFIRFVTELPPRVTEAVVFGRRDPQPGSRLYPLSSEGVRFVALPHYPNVRALRPLLGAIRGSCVRFADELERLDAVWIFGPHPLAVLFAWIARRRGVPLFLGVRQDYPRYIENRLPSRRWAWAVPAAHVLDLAFRHLARTAPTVALGAEIASRYEGGAPVLTTGFSLVGAAELVRAEEAVAKAWDGELRVLSVGRLDPEKNPLLLPEILARLRRAEPRWRLTIAGSGPLRSALERRIEELGIRDAVDLLGDVANGPPLWELYRGSHAFLHVSLTEGLPQVLAEAHAAGIPIVATAVGGVPEASGGGTRALLVPPDDADAVVVQLERLRVEPDLRRRLITVGLEHVASETLEVQLDRVVAFFRAHLNGAARATARDAAERGRA